MPCGGRASRERRGAVRDGGTWEVIPGGKDMALGGGRKASGRGRGSREFPVVAREAVE